MPSESTTDGSHKHVLIEDLRGLGEEARRAGRRIVYSHGIFDLLHPGHIDHLQQARELGDILVVSVTSDREVRRGPGRPVFPQEVRMRSLAALACVDHVVLSDHGSAVPVIEALRPAVYVKGREYADAAHDLTGKFAAERARVEELGGETHLVGGAVYSSTSLLNQHFGALPPDARDFAADFRQRWSDSAIRAIVNSFAALRVLVVGEAIIDEYVTCQVQGVTPKERVPSVRPLATQRHWGGGYAVARHLASCCHSVTLAGIAAPGEEIAGAAVPAGASPLVEREFVLDAAARTITKRRYVAENKPRGELTKVFAVSELPDPAQLSEQTRHAFRDRVTALMAKADLVVISDYGHGLLDQETMDVIQQGARMLALNCQTNSSNTGFNLITKYSRADTFTLDHNELSLAYGVETNEPARLLERLRSALGSRQGWLTRGSAGAIGCDDASGIHPIPALTLRVRDTLGAGDAFFAWATVAAATDQPLEIGSFLGSLAGSLATEITGNARGVEKSDLLRFASTILNV